MGNCKSKRRSDHEYGKVTRNVISFPKCVEMGFVQGGDLLFIQDQMLIDAYTKMNTQTAHYVQKLLRTKTKLEEHKVEHQWCRVGIVLDSAIPQVKYLMEFSEDGFVKHEFMQRVLYLKTRGNVFGIKRLRRALTPEQSGYLKLLSDSFKKDFNSKKQMAALYDIDTREDEDDKANAPMPSNPNFGGGGNFGQKQKTKGYQEDAIGGVGAQDFDNNQNVQFGGKKAKGEKQDMDGFNPDLVPEEQLTIPKWAHVDILRTALKNTKRNLLEIDEDGLIFAQMWEIFRIFTAESEEMDGDESFESGHSQTYKSVRDGAQASQKMMPLKDVPWFIKYFKVANDDDHYFEQCIRTMSAMADVESYVENGITFKHLLQELHECNFFLNTQMTEVEPQSCFNAQITMLILEKIGLTDDSERLTGFFRDVNDLCENVDGRSAEEYSRGQQEFAPFIYTPTLTVQTLYNDK